MAKQIFGRCASCGHREGVQNAFGTGIGVSDAFSDLALWADPLGRSMCEVCASNYTTKELRRYSHWTNDMVVWVPSTREWLIDALSAPLLCDVAVTLPIGGQKHVWHHARFGCVAFDNGQIPWRDAESAAFRSCLELRSHGMTEGGLAEAELRWANLMRCTNSNRASLMQSWDRWQTITKTRKDLQEICILGSRPPKGVNNEFE
jgi:hypothetical protein